MIAAVVFLAGATAVLAAVVCALVVQAQRERNQWAAERGRLVDRAIARHSGEVIALDREAHRDTNGADPDERHEPQLIEGLS
jgi:hypothetical protein